MSSALTGIKGVDMGIAALGMHSVRETAWVLDCMYFEKALIGFYNDYEEM
mgnify:CR=1 FL=1